MLEPARAAVAARLHLLFFAVTTAYVMAFAAMPLLHLWLWNRTGGLQPFDFVDVYSAGKLALAGHRWAIYDWNTHRVAEAAALAHPISWKDYYGWHYPPPLLFIAAALATLPYLAAFFLWPLGTLPFYLLAVRKAASHPGAWLAASAFPATFFNIAVGQNGFLTASLMGGALLMLGTRPLLAGLLIGLLAYKPQFGILIPLALVAGGHWRSFAAATITVVASSTASMASAAGSASVCLWLPCCKRNHRHRNTGGHLAVEEQRAAQSESGRTDRGIPSRHALSLRL